MQKKMKNYLNKSTFQRLWKRMLIYMNTGFAVLQCTL